ncbi:MAG: Uma2 family endonuclease [Acidobacteriota bacterium]|nr:Uma2 family endonuclease [Acidobacteriota bacterium]
MSTNIRATIDDQRNAILEEARAKANEMRVGMYTIAVEADGTVEEIDDAPSLEILLASGAEVHYHGILIDGKGGATGAAPNNAALEICVSLREYSRRTKRGRAVADNAGFRLPNGKFVSPDAAYHVGKWTRMKFYEGAPVFAVEVRSESDYGPKAEINMARKRADYFAAGTLVVWDVDLLSDDVVKVYRATEPIEPTIYRRGDIAEAEPAVPGWSMAVEEIFEQEV